MKLTHTLLLLSLAAGLASCGQGEPETPTSSSSSAEQQSSAAADSPSTDDLKVSLVTIAPGGSTPVDIEPSAAEKFDGNPEQIAAGRQLFTAYNCVGCHFNGGGGMGPALMDDTWIYGSSMENIAATIIEGRPNGMPTFRALVSGDQVWQLAAYVRSLSNLAEKQSAKSTQ